MTPFLRLSRQLIFHHPLLTGVNLVTLARYVSTLYQNRNRSEKIWVQSCTRTEKIWSKIYRSKCGDCSNNFDPVFTWRSRFNLSVVLVEFGENPRRDPTCERSVRGLPFAVTNSFFRELLSTNISRVLTSHFLVIVCAQLLHCFTSDLTRDQQQYNQNFNFQEEVKVLCFLLGGPKIEISKFSAIQEPLKLH